MPGSLESAETIHIPGPESRKTYCAASYTDLLLVLHQEIGDAEIIFIQEVHAVDGLAARIIGMEVADGLQDDLCACGGIPPLVDIILRTMV